MHLLVVDDEETLRSVVSQVLEADGFVVSEAASASSTASWVPAKVPHASA